MELGKGEIVLGNLDTPWAKTHAARTHCCLLSKCLHAGLCADGNFELPSLKHSTTVHTATLSAPVIAATCTPILLASMQTAIISNARSPTSVREVWYQQFHQRDLPALLGVCPYGPAAWPDPSHLAFFGLLSEAFPPPACPHNKLYTTVSTLHDNTGRGI